MLSLGFTGSRDSPRLRIGGKSARETYEKDECAGAKDAESVSDEEFQRRILEKNLPVYPPAAKAVRATGTTVFDVLVGEDGKPQCVVPRRGHPLLRSALEKAIKNWKFASAQKGYAGRLLIEGKVALMLNGEIVE